MPIGGRQKSCTGFYHVMTRGVARQLIFEDDKDRFKLLGLIKSYASQDDLEIHAYCLMDNHFHILAKGELTGLSHFMNRVCSEYANYYNIKYGRVGRLFQGRFQSEVIEDEAYFLTVLRYILQNPEKAHLSSMAEYRWSSYKDFAQGGGLTETSFALKLLGGKQNLLEYVRLSGEDDSFLDDGWTASPKKDVLQFMANDLHLPLSDFQKLDRDRRNSCLRTMREEGYSLRQIERAVGISKDTIARICRI